MEVVLVFLLAAAFSAVLIARTRRRHRDPAAHIDDFRSALNRLAASSQTPVQPEQLQTTPTATGSTSEQKTSSSG